MIDKIVLNNKTLDDIDLSKYFSYLGSKYQPYFSEVSGKEHYRLLAYLSTLFDGCNILDVGTHTAASALALSYNTQNKVDTIDIKDRLGWVKGAIEEDFENIKFHIGDVYEGDLISNSDLILYDTTHQGVLEREFHRHLVESGWKGICIWDDITLDYHGKKRQVMIDFWDDIEHTKFDISKYAHWTGTGIVFYNCEPEVVTQ